MINGRYNNFMKFDVKISNHGRYMDDESRASISFNSEKEAIDECKEIVDESIFELHKTGMSPEELFSMYTQFGDDPYVICGEKKIEFSSFDYAKIKCTEICDKDMWWFPPD